MSTCFSCDHLNPDGSCMYGEGRVCMHMETHDAKVMADAIEEYKEEILSRFCECCDQYACEGAMIGSMQECTTIIMLRDVCADVATELKERKND